MISSRREYRVSSDTNEVWAPNAEELVALICVLIIDLYASLDNPKIVE